jgi:NADH:ubiquinone oxidoreductase subunit K
MGTRTAIVFLMSAFLAADGLFLVYVAGNIIFSSSEGAIFQWWIAIPGIGLVVVGCVLFLWFLRRHNIEVRKGV